MNTAVHLIAFGALVWGVWIMARYRAQRNLAMRCMQMLLISNSTIKKPYYLLTNPCLLISHLFALLALPCTHSSSLVTLRAKPFLKRVAINKVLFVFQELHALGAPMLGAQIYWKSSGFSGLLPQNIEIFVRSPQDLSLLAKQEIALTDLLGVQTILRTEKPVTTHACS